MRGAPRNDAAPPVRLARTSPITANEAIAPKMKNGNDGIPYSFPVGRNDATTPNATSTRPHVVANTVSAASNRRQLGVDRTLSTPLTTRYAVSSPIGTFA